MRSLAPPPSWKAASLRASGVAVQGCSLVVQARFGHFFHVIHTVLCRPVLCSHAWKPPPGGYVEVELLSYPHPPGPVYLPVSLSDGDTHPFRASNLCMSSTIVDTNFTHSEVLRFYGAKAGQTIPECFPRNHQWRTCGSNSGIGMRTLRFSETK